MLQAIDQKEGTGYLAYEADWLQKLAAAYMPHRVLITRIMLLVGWPAPVIKHTSIRVLHVQDSHGTRVQSPAITQTHTRQKSMLSNPVGACIFSDCVLFFIFYLKLFSTFFFFFFPPNVHQPENYNY